jgi:hypothetical protein
VAGGRPRTLEPYQSRTDRTGCARCQCTATVQMDTFARPRGWYDSRNFNSQVLCN